MSEPGMRNEARGQQRGPLANLRVLDLGTMIAGPVAATLLADFGAEVVKVEQPGIGDPLREIGPFVDNESLYWNVEGRNKKSITLDLRKPEGQALARQLAAKVDVVVENFRPGTLAAWGLDYDALSALNPGLVMLSVSGFGQTGPYAQRAAFDRIALAFSGVLHISGFADRPPVRPGVTMADYQSALFGAYAVMMALYHRDANGGAGQHIDLGLYESVFRFTDTLAPAYDRLGEVRQRQGNLAAAAAPGDIFETCDGRYLVLTMSNDAMFRRLCDAMGTPALADDPRYVTHRLRWGHVAQLNAIVARWIKGRAVAEIEAALQDAGLAYTLTYSIEDIFSDPHYLARGSIESVENPRIGTVRMPGVGPRLSATPAGPIRSAPTLAEHNDEVFGEWLGLSDAVQRQLREAAVI